MDISWFSKIFG